MTNAQRTVVIVLGVLCAIVTAVGVAGVWLLVQIGQDLEDFEIVIGDEFVVNVDNSPVLPASAIGVYGSYPNLDRIADNCAGSGKRAGRACARLAYSLAELPADLKPGDYRDYQEYGYACGERPGRSFGCRPDAD